MIASFFIKRLAKICRNNNFLNMRGRFFSESSNERIQDQSHSYAE